MRFTARAGNRAAPGLGIHTPAAASHTHQDAILDFFGVSVKAAELLATCSHMRLLARKVAAVREPAVTNFKLDANCCLSVPKWGKVRQEGCQAAARKARGRSRRHGRGLYMSYVGQVRHVIVVCIAGAASMCFVSLIRMRLTHRGPGYSELHIAWKCRSRGPVDC